MHGMPEADGTAVLHWEWAAPVGGVVSAIAAIWWMRRRSVWSGIATAAGLFVVAVAPNVRTLAVGSHLVMMVLLEVAVTAIPLMIVLAWRRPLRGEIASAGRWHHIWILACTVAYVALLIAVHLPVIRDVVLEGAPLPSWAVVMAVGVGTAYWSAVLRSPVAAALRRAALVIGQEVAAMIGLVTVLGGGAAMGTAGSGALAGWDHRLGGAVMLTACAAVSVPMLRKLSRDASERGRHDDAPSADG
jgi:hypothetical protein